MHIPNGESDVYGLDIPFPYDFCIHVDVGPFLILTDKHTLVQSYRRRKQCLSQFVYDMRIVITEIGLDRDLGRVPAADPSLGPEGGVE